MQLYLSWSFPTAEDKDKVLITKKLIKGRLLGIPYIWVWNDAILTKENVTNKIKKSKFKTHIRRRWLTQFQARVL